MVTDRIQVSAVSDDVHLFAINRQPAAPMTTIMEMGDRQELGELIPEVPIDVPVANEAVTKQRRWRSFGASGACVLPDVETSAVAS